MSFHDITRETIVKFLAALGALKQQAASLSLQPDAGNTPACCFSVRAGALTHSDHQRGWLSDRFLLARRPIRCIGDSRAMLRRRGQGVIGTIEACEGYWSDPASGHRLAAPGS